MLKAILAVSFGTSHAHTREKTIGAIEQAFTAEFPDRMLRRAFTSKIILKKLAERDGIHIDSVREGLERMIADGVEDVVIAPTHILNGEEYEGVAAEAAAFGGRFASLRMSAPLLTATSDYVALVEAVSARFPRRECTALCLMGHGTGHFSDSAYAALDYHFKNSGREDVFVGAVEGFPDLDTLLRRVRAYAPRCVTLAPLMVVAGEHAANDMAGGQDSWKTAFQSAGCAVDCVLEGLGEYAAVRDLYVAHVRSALER